MTERFLHIVKPATAPRDPQARKAYVEELRARYEAGGLVAKRREGEPPTALVESVFPHLAPRRIAQA